MPNLPPSTGATRGVITTLLSLGDSAGALRHADAHRTLVEGDSSHSLEPSFVRLIESIRSTAYDAETRLIPPPASPTPELEEPSDARAAGAPVPAADPHQHPWRRWRYAAGVAVVCAVLAMGAAVPALRSRPPPLNPRRVAIVTSLAGSSAWSRSAAAKRTVDGIARRLAADASLTPLVLQLADGDDVRRAASAAGARLLLSVSADSVDVLEASLTDAASQQLLWGLRLAASGPTAMGRLADSLAERAATATAVRRDRRMMNWIGTSSEPTSYESYVEFVRGLDLYADMQPEAAELRFRQAAKDTSFTMALVMAAWANHGTGRSNAADSMVRTLQPRRLPRLDRAMVDHQLAVFRQDRAAEYQLARAVADVVPQSEWRFFLAESATRVGRAREAVRVLEEMGPDLGWVGASFRYWMVLSRNLHFLGEHERELVVTDEGLRRFPTNRILAQMRLKALAALGRVADVDVAIDQAMTFRPKGNWGDLQPMDQTALELAAHGYPEAARHVAARALAWMRQQPLEVQKGWKEVVPALLWEAGRADEARQQLERMAAQGPVGAEYLVILAVTCAEQGDSASARRIDAQLASGRFEDSRADLLIGRASIMASLGEREAAVEFIREAYRLGYEWRNVVHIQPAMGRLTGYAPYEALVRPVQ